MNENSKEWFKTFWIADKKAFKGCLTNTIFINKETLEISYSNEFGPFKEELLSYWYSHKQETLEKNKKHLSA